MMGGFIAARELKRSRDRLITQYPFLSNLYVDNSGNCAAVSQPLTDDDAQLVKAFGELISGYYSACASISPKVKVHSLREILHEYALELSRIGFWN
jgi:hypothetical protein